MLSSSAVRFSGWLGLSLLAIASAPLAAEEVPLYRHRDPQWEVRQALLRNQAPSRTARLAPAPLHSLSAVTRDELYRALTRAGFEAPFAGLHRELSPETLAAGRWEPAGAGAMVWRLAIHSPNATGMRVHFKDFRGAAGRLWVHDGKDDGAQIFGPYENAGPHGDGAFWSDVVVGDTIVLEYLTGAGEAGLPPPFLPDRASHILAGLTPDREALGAELRAKGLESPEARAAIDRLLEPAARGPERNVGSCHLDVSCYGDWADTAKSVGWIVFETPEGTAVCSGTLINTRASSGRPYFLTADHCISNDATARTMNVFWFFQTPSCGGAPADPRTLPRSRGLAYLGGRGYTRGDSSLNLLDGVPSGVSFSGWTTDTPAEGVEITGVSHPAGSHKRISFGILGPRSRDAAVPALDEDYYGVRYSTRGLVEPGSSGSGLFTAPGVLAGILSHGRKPTSKSAEAYCEFLPFSVNYGRFNVSYPLFRDLLEDRAASTPPPAPPTGGGGAGGATPRTLNSGETVTAVLGPVAAPTLFNGAEAFQIAVRENSARLDIRTSFASPADVALYVRLGAPPVVSEGQVIADYAVESFGGVKTLSVTSASRPPLRAGTYYIALGLRTVNAQAAGTITVTVTPNQGRILTSGNTERLRFNPSSTPTWLIGPTGFSIAVPDGATRLEVRIFSPERGDLDLFARFGESPVITGSTGRDAIADHKSQGAGADETIIVTPNSNPPLRAGVYYIAVLNYNNATGLNAELKATVTGGTGGAGPNGTRRLVSGSPVFVRLPAVTSPTLFMGQFSYTLDVPEGATRLEIKYSPGDTGYNTDLFVRLGQDVGLSSAGVVIADWRGTNATAEETIVITPASSPPLRGGTYYISMAQWTLSKAVTGTLTATVTGGIGPRIAGGRRSLVSGQPVFFSIQSQGRFNELMNGERGFVVNVPQGATKLEISTVAMQSGSGIDMDLHARYSADVTERSTTCSGDSNNCVVADWSSVNFDNNEKITIPRFTTDPPLRPGLYYIAFWKYFYSSGSSADFTITATITGGSSSAAPPPGGVPRELGAGQSGRFFLGPVDVPSLFGGANGFSVTVPQGATRLEVKLATDTPNADVDLIVRRGSEPTVEAGEVKADYWPSEPSGNETLIITTNSSPPLQPGTYYISLGLLTLRTVVSGTVSVNFSSGDPGSAQTGGNYLISGQPRTVNIPAVAEPSLFSGANGFRIEVPQGATRLDIRLTSPTAGVDIDLFARHGQEVTAPGGRVVADHASESAGADETITITASSSPPLRGGVYYIAYAMFTRNTAAAATITATLTTGTGNQPPASGPRRLTSGQPANYSIGPVTSPTLFNGNAGFLIDVPANATRLEIALRTPDATADVDLHARSGQDVGLSGGRVVADTSSTIDGGNENIVLTGSALKSGTYYIALGLFTLNKTVTGTITATVSTGGGGGPSPRTLTSGVPVNFRLGPVDSPTIFTGENSFQVQVPAGATRLELRLQTSTPNADADMFARFGQDNAVAEGRPVSDHAAEGPTGAETLVITPQSNPPLRAGTYYVSISLYTTGVEVSCSLTATVSGGGSGPTTPPSGSATVLTSGTPGKFSYPAAAVPTLYNGNSGFRFTVPEGATRVLIRIVPDQTNVDTDLFARLNADVEVRDGQTIADYAGATDAGPELIEITSSSNPPLRAGTYYLAISVHTINTPASGIISATVERGTVAPPISTVPILTPGLPVRIDLPPAGQAVLIGGDFGFRVVVPANGSRLDIRLNLDDLDIEMDVVARFNQEPAVNQGQILADHRSVNEVVGVEQLVIDGSTSPPLRAGTYFVSFVVFTTGRSVRGGLSVTLGTSTALGDSSLRKTARQTEGAVPLAWKSYGPLIQPLNGAAYFDRRQAALPRRYRDHGAKPALRSFEEP